MAVCESYLSLLRHRFGFPEREDIAFAPPFRHVGPRPVYDSFVVNRDVTALEYGEAHVLVRFVHNSEECMRIFPRLPDYNNIGEESHICMD